MMAKASGTPLDPALHRVRLDSLRIFEISEAELDALERGSPESLFLNLALAVLSIAISFSVALATTKVDSIRTFTVFVVVVVVGYLAGITFGVLWLMSRRSLKSTAAKIRARIPSEGIQEPTKSTEPSPHS
jgi:hypothetical protein